MSHWFALLYKLKPGTEAAVEELFAKSGRPEHDIRSEDGTIKGQLLRTLVFMGTGMCVRVLEVDGDLAQVAAHMSQQKSVREFEREVEKYLAVHRDMKSRAGAQQFFRESGMRCVLNRHRED